MGAIQEVIGRYAGLIRKDRRLLIVLVTDESGDDGGKIEEARQAAVSRGVPIYVIGRQSLFGYDRAHLRYIDPVTKDEYWPAVRRGPETADIEMLQWDGLHVRWDEQPSGFAPYELARLPRPPSACISAPQRGELAAPPQGEGVLDRDAEGVPARLREPGELLREADRRSSAGPCTDHRHDQALPVPAPLPVDPEAMIPAATAAGALCHGTSQRPLAIQTRLERCRSCATASRTSVGRRTST